MSMISKCVLVVLIGIVSNLSLGDVRNATGKRKDKVDKGTIDFSKGGLFTGDVSFSIPIASLGGISLELTYNSNMHTLVRVQNKFSQSGWVGLGWSMNLGSIVGDINNTRDVSDDRYYLVDNGISSELVRESGDNFIIRDYRYWKITRHVVNGSIVGWIIVTEDGTTKRFGNTDDITDTTFVLDLPPKYATRFVLGWADLVANHAGVGSPSYIPYQWDLSDIQDVNGNHTTVKYQQSTGTLSGTSLTYTRESYPQEIVDRTGRKIVFVLNGSALITIDNPLVGYGQSRYETLSLSYVYEKDPNNITYSGFQFEYDVDDVFDKATLTNKKIYLKRIKQLDAGLVSIRDTKFEYSGVGTALQPADFNPGSIKKITLPEGGTIEYTYSAQEVITNRDEVIASGGNFWSSYGRGRLASNSEFWSLSGSDFFVINKSSLLKAYRWDHTNRMALDNSFPLTVHNYTANSGYWVNNDYVILKTGTSLLVAKRDGEGWRHYTIEDCIFDITKLEVVGLGSDYFLYATDCTYAGSAPLNGVLKVATFRNDHTWSVQTIGTRFVGAPQNVSCGNRFFAGGYNLGVWNWNEALGLWQDKTPSGNYSNYDNVGGDYIVKKGAGQSDFTVYRWSGSAWTPYYLSPTVSVPAGVQFHTGNNFFVIRGVGSGSSHLKIVTYTSSGWTSQDISEVFNMVDLGVGIDDRARVAVGPDYIVVTWRNGATSTWRIGLTRYKNGQWQSGVLLNSYPATSSGYETFTPFVSGSTIFAELYEPGTKLQTHSFTEYENGWDSQLTSDLNLGWYSEYENPLKPFVQPGGNFSVCVIDQNLKNGGDGQLLAWKKTNGIDFREVFTDAIDGGYDYFVATKKVSDGMGNIMETSFVFEKGVYDDNIQFVRYNKATETPTGSNGKTVSLFYNKKGVGDAEDFINVPNYETMDGLPYKTKIFANGSGTPVSETVNTWSAVPMVTLPADRTDPIETQDPGSWTSIPPGPPFHEVIDDGDIVDPSDYVYTTTGFDVFRVKLRAPWNNPLSSSGNSVVTIDAKPHSGQASSFFLILQEWNGSSFVDLKSQLFNLLSTQTEFQPFTMSVPNSWISDSSKLYVMVECLNSTIDVARIKCNFDALITNGHHRRLLQETSSLDGVVKIVGNDYLSSNGLVMRSTETNSDGTQRITEVKYAHEQYVGMNATGTHMMIQPYATSVKKGSSDIESKEWTIWSNSDGKWRPREDWVWRGDGSANDLTAPSDPGDGETYKSAKYETYDNFGNLLQSRDVNNTPTTVKWGFNSAVPTGEFRNATDGETFFAFFDDGTLSNWSGAGTWVIENGVYRQTDPSTTAPWDDSRVNSTTSVDDAIVEGHIRFDNEGTYRYAGLAKYVDFNNFVRFELRKYDSPQKVRIYARKAGSNAYIDANFSFNENQWYRVKGEIQGNVARMYIDGALVVTYTHGNVDLAAGKVGLCTFGTVASFDNIRIYPAKALATSTSYDPVTLNVAQFHDENAAMTRYEYDRFQRLARILSPDNRVISENSYYYSRLANNDVFTPSDPNIVEEANYSQGIPKSNLRGHWRFEGNAEDASGKNGLGTLYGNAAVKKRAYLGSGLELDGTGDYMSVPYNSALNVAANRITVAAWVKFSTTSSYRFIVEKGASTGKQYYMWRHATAGIVVGYHDGSVFRDYIYGWTPTVGVWYHLAWTADGSNIRIYVDGVLVASPVQTGSIQSSLTGELNIGKNVGGSYYFSGAIDEVMLFDRALSDAEVSSLARPHVQATFQDGLGRSMQAQSRLGTNNIISSTTYDQMGRESRAYKPYQINLGSNAHKYDSAFATNSDVYYNAITEAESKTNGYPYNETRYLADPLSRVDKLGAPGLPFRIGASPEKVTRFEYLSNAGTEFTGYSAGSLFKNRKRDEDDKILDSFVDKFGNTVASIVDPTGTPLKTIMKYDVLENLTESEPPKGSAYKTTYSYTPLRQLRQKTSPDAGIAQYLYDKNGNLRLMKDANHSSGSTNTFSVSWTDVSDPYSYSNSLTLDLPGKVIVGARRYGGGGYIQIRIKATNGTLLFSFNGSDFTPVYSSVTLPKGPFIYEVQTFGGGAYSYTLTCATGYELNYNKYDSHNRIVETGEYESTSISSLNQANADNITFPSSGQVLSRLSVYDNPAPVATYPLATDQRNVKGRLSYALSYRLGSLAVTTLYSYDELGRIDWIAHYNLGSFAKKIKYQYDLQGRVTKKEYFDFQASPNYNLYTYNEYDQTGRLTKVSTNSVDNPGTALKEGEYSYYAAGTTKDLKLGNNIQQVDYRYNSRDWLSRINDVDNANGEPFAQNLHYNLTSPLTSTARFNGNISGIRWYNAGVGIDPKLGYAFFYDNMNRLKTAQTYTYNGSWNPSNKYKEPMVTYDANGNILTYERYGHDGISMDNLTYRFIGNTNKIDSLDESVASNSYSTDIDSQPPGNYKYDANGNMLQDLGRGIGFTIYDPDNMPVTAYYTDGNVDKYYYDADGNRVRKDEAGTEYYVVGAGGEKEVIVSSDGLQAIHQTYGIDNVGQVRRSNTTWTRYYYLKDHLGSTRVTVNSSGSVDGYHDFYPFGMTMELRSLVGSADARLRFTGQELDGRSKNYAFGFRSYDALKGGWNSTDPMEEYPSPFTYVGNNPVGWIDFFGLFSSDTTYTADMPEVEVVGQDKSESYVIEYVGLELAVGYDMIFGDRGGYYGHEYFNVGGQYYKSIDLRTRYVGGVPPGLEMIGGKGVAKVGISVFSKLGIRTKPHFFLRLAQRGSRGATAEAALNAYNRGRLYYNPQSRNFIRHDPTTGVSIVVDKPVGGTIATVFEGKPSPRWVPVHWRPGN